MDVVGEVEEVDVGVGGVGVVGARHLELVWGWVLLVPDWGGSQGQVTFIIRELTTGLIHPTLCFLAART